MNHHALKTNLVGGSALGPLAILLLMNLFLSAHSAHAQWDGPAPDGDIYYNGGKVGIGTTDPKRTLHVVGGLLVSGSEVDATTKNTTLESWHYSSNEETVLYLWGLSTTNHNILRLGSSHSAYNAPTKLEFYTAESNTTLGGTRRMVINQSGNVGIWKDNPTERLEVNGNVKLSGDLLSSDDEIQLRNTATGTGVVLLANGDVCIGSGC